MVIVLLGLAVELPRRTAKQRQPIVRRLVCPLPSFQMYQSRCLEVREARESMNHLFWSEVWFNTKSR